METGLCAYETNTRLEIKGTVFSVAELEEHSEDEKALPSGGRGSCVPGWDECQVNRNPEGNRKELPG